MVESGVARKLDVHVWMNEKYEVVENEKYAFGRR